jgi:hypothetical protein
LLQQILALFLNIRSYIDVDCAPFSPLPFTLYSAAIYPSFPNIHSRRTLRRHSLSPFTSPPSLFTLWPFTADLHFAALHSHPLPCHPSPCIPPLFPAHCTTLQYRPSLRDPSIAPFSIPLFTLHPVVLHCRPTLLPFTPPLFPLTLNSGAPTPSPRRALARSTGRE